MTGNETADMSQDGTQNIQAGEETAVSTDETKPLLAPAVKIKDDKMFYQKVTGYMAYCLLLFLATYLLNQLSRYMLAITTKPMAQEIHYGDQGCMLNTSFTEAQLGKLKCNGTTIASCANVTDYKNRSLCKWDYTGDGFQYQILAGPVFILIYTFAGIFIAFAADRFNRKFLLAGCLIFWSVMTVLTGFVKTYWQLVLLRFGLGLGEAGCTPFVASMIADLFPIELRGTALGIYNWGIYMGYSMSYAIGNLITEANINGQGWRWTYFISGIPGIFVGILMLVTMKEPERKKAVIDDPKNTPANPDEVMSFRTKVIKVLRPFLSPSLIIAVLAGSVRNAAGYTFAYNTQLYFTAIGETKQDIAKYMGWIPVVGGSLGVLVGGFVSDRVVKTRGIYARVIVVIASLVIAAPFAAGTLFFNPPWAYICQIPTYIFGEMWIGVTLAIVVELVPSDIKTAAVAVYLFIISNIGGNMPLLVPVITSDLQADGYAKPDALRGALYILYPGFYVLGAALFVPAMLAMKRDQERVRQMEYVRMEDKAID